MYKDSLVKYCSRFLITTLQIQSSLLLVVPDTEYSIKLLILLGTNILQVLFTNCKENLGKNIFFRMRLYIHHGIWHLDA